jgi:hypothetical protein
MVLFSFYAKGMLIDYKLYKLDQMSAKSDQKIVEKYADSIISYAPKDYNLHFEIAKTINNKCFNKLSVKYFNSALRLKYKKENVKINFAKLSMMRTLDE